LTLQQEPPRDDVVRDFPRVFKKNDGEVAIAQPERGVIALEGDGSGRGGALDAWSSG
jgi:hypothetical protein